MTTSPEWFDAAFRALYLDVYAHRDEASAAREVDHVAGRLDPAAGPLLDAGCGAGRHSRALAARGFRVVGLDRSSDLLAAAMRGGAPREGSLRYVRGDFRALPIRTGAMAHVASLFTAFGYFDDAGNSRQLAEFRRVMSPGGRLVLDFLNAERVAATLVPRSERDVAGVRIIEERAIRAGRVEKDVRIERTGDAAPPAMWRESVRLYKRTELVRRVEEAGFAVDAVAGDLDGAPWNAGSPRCVVWATAR